MNSTHAHKPGVVAGGAWASRPSLLVADDDAFVRTMLSSRLGDDFDCVADAADAMDAVALVDAYRPDVAILDVAMPAGGAQFAVPAIRERCPDTAIVILSGDYTPATAWTLLDAGANAYLHKDIDPRVLTAELNAAIHSHQCSRVIS